MIPVINNAFNNLTDPRQDPNWVTNLTGNPAHDDDIAYLAPIDKPFSSNQLFTSTVDLARFIGTGNLDFTAKITGASQVTGAGNFSSFIRTAASAEFQVIYTYCTSAPMPVNLVSFQGKWMKDQGNELSWVTSWEKNNDRFEVQRSADAKSFESVGRVAGNGSTAAQQSYTYMDAHPLADLTYYRLKQVDEDGKFVYSKIVGVRQGVVDKSFVIYPNPVTDQLRLKLTDQTISETSLYDLNGQRVLHQTTGAAQVQLGFLKAGMYVVEAKTTAGVVYRQRFVKH